MSGEDKMIHMESVNKDYQIGEHSVSALADVTLNIPKNSFLGIKGPSGSGKSTLLNIIGLIDVPTTGQYKLDSKTVSVTNARERALLRKQYFGFVFQDFNLVPELDVYHNVELPLLINSVPLRERKPKIKKIVEELGLTEWIHHRPFQLSGGQQQRVSIARALVKEPSIVLADEPTANLDSTMASQVIEIMREINKSHGTTFIISSHDPLVIGKLNVVIELKDGHISGVTIPSKKGGEK
jgi:putative ABC transport system ATP-binding protein